MGNVWPSQYLSCSFEWTQACISISLSSKSNDLGYETITNFHQYPIHERKSHLRKGLHNRSSWFEQKQFFHRVFLYEGYIKWSESLASSMLDDNKQLWISLLWSLLFTQETSFTNLTDKKCLIIGYSINNDRFESYMHEFYETTSAVDHDLTESSVSDEDSRSSQSQTEIKCVSNECNI